MAINTSTREFAEAEAHAINADIESILGDVAMIANTHGLPQVELANPHGEGPLTTLAYRIEWMLNFPRSQFASDQDRRDSLEVAMQQAAAARYADRDAFLVAQARRARYHR